MKDGLRTQDISALVSYEPFGTKEGLV